MAVINQILRLTVGLGLLAPARWPCEPDQAGLPLKDFSVFFNPFRERPETISFQPLAALEGEAGA